LVTFCRSTKSLRSKPFQEPMIIIDKAPRKNRIFVTKPSTDCKYASFEPFP